jgi:hypothetical protein
LDNLPPLHLDGCDAIADAVAIQEGPNFSRQETLVDDIQELCKQLLCAQVLQVHVCTENFLVLVLLTLTLVLTAALM